MKQRDPHTSNQSWIASVCYLFDIYSTFLQVYIALFPSVPLPSPPNALEGSQVTQRTLVAESGEPEFPYPSSVFEPLSHASSLCLSSLWEHWSWFWNEDWCLAWCLNYDLFNKYVWNKNSLGQLVKRVLKFKEICSSVGWRKIKEVWLTFNFFSDTALF